MSVSNFNFKFQIETVASNFSYNLQIQTSTLDKTLNPLLIFLFKMQLQTLHQSSTSSCNYSTSIISLKLQLQRFINAASSAKQLVDLTLSQKKSVFNQEESNFFIHMSISQRIL